MANISQTSDYGRTCPPIRNRYFYGKLLDVGNFELEQSYFNSKRWMLNRLVTGYGVVCGLGVNLVPGTQTIVVQPGTAIDKCGREILVCAPSDPITLPAPSTPAPASGGTAAGAVSGTPAPNNNSGEHCDGTYVHVSFCYHECPSDPVPTMGGDCDVQGLCSAGSIRERYQIEVGDGKLAPASTSSRIQDVIYNGQLNYGALANYVSSPCSTRVDDCCIPLANIRIPDTGGSYDQTDIDITVRPIVYTNDLLYELILAFMNQGQNQARGGKP
jgi:hypothetical protein